MNSVKTLLKLAAAVAAVAGITYVVYKNIDAITNWLSKLCPCKSAPEVEEIIEEPTAEEAVEEVVEEIVAEEAPVEIPEGEPVAEESDFEA